MDSEKRDSKIVEADGSKPRGNDRITDNVSEIEDIKVEKEGNSEKGKNKKTKKRKKKAPKTMEVPKSAESKETDETNLDDENEKNETQIDISEWEPLRLHPSLLKAISSLGFSAPTPIQKACIPAASFQGKVLEKIYKKN